MQIFECTDFDTFPVTLVTNKPNKLMFFCRKLS